MAPTYKTKIRVNQAGESGAVHIYHGQLAVLGNGQARDAIRHMLEQERRHLDMFNTLMIQTNTPRTWLAPVWHLGGWALGAATAFLGEHSAMACTDAVEEEINQHYQKQLDTLAACADELPAQLIETIKICHADELAHQATAINHGSHQAPYYPLMTKVIRKITRAAIALSKRI